MTTKITVSLPDETAAFIRENSGGNASAYVDRAIKRLMLKEALRHHPKPDWDDSFSAHDSFGPTSGEERA